MLLNKTDSDFECQTYFKQELTSIKPEKKSGR